MHIRKPFRLPGRRNWYVEVDRQRRSTGTADKNEALKVYRELRVQADLAETEFQNSIPWNRFRDEYQKWSRQVHRPKTVEAENASMDKLEDLLGTTARVDQITPKHADQLVSKLLSKGLKPGSVNLHIRHLKAILNRAKAWDHIKENPFSGIKALPRKKKPPAFIPPDKIPAFLKSITDQDFRSLIAAYLATGRRRSELLALEWAHVGLEDGLYRVPQSKTHMDKVYPINAVFRAILSTRGGTEGRVWPRWQPDTVTRMTKKALRDFGLGHLRLHDLRHSFASAYLMAGGDLRSLMELLGHTQISTTTVYSHLTQDHVQREAERVTFAYSAS